LIKSTPGLCCNRSGTKYTLTHATHRSSSTFTCKTMPYQIVRRSRFLSVFGTTIHLSRAFCECTTELIALIHFCQNAKLKTAFIDSARLVLIQVNSIPGFTASFAPWLISESNLLPLLFFVLLLLLPPKLDDSAASLRLCLSSSTIYQKGLRFVTLFCL